jgi:hypothetical protein
MFNEMRLTHRNGRNFRIRGLIPIGNGTLENPPKPTHEYQQFAVFTGDQWVLVNARDIERIETDLPVAVGAVPSTN